MNNIKIYLSLFSCLTFGCASHSEPETILVTKRELVPIPDFYLSDCLFPPPPKEAEYIKLNFTDKEKVLVDIYLEAAEQNKKCNIRLKNAREYQDRLKQIYQEVSDDHEEHLKIHSG